MFHNIMGKVALVDPEFDAASVQEDDMVMSAVAAERQAIREMSATRRQRKLEERHRQWKLSEADE